MFGLLLKLVLITAVIGGIVGYVAIKVGQSPKELAKSLARPENYEEVVQKVDTKMIVAQASNFLDNIITHGNSNSPMVLGLKVTNESLGAITDVLQKLPSDQLNQIRSVVCASPSAN